MIQLSKTQKRQLEAWSETHTFELKDLSNQLKRKPSLIHRLLRQLDMLIPPESEKIIIDIVFNNKKISDEDLQILRNNLINNKTNRIKLDKFFSTSKGKKLLAWLYLEDGIEFILTNLESLKDHPVATPAQKLALVEFERLIIFSALDAGIRTRTQLKTLHEQTSYIVGKCVIDRLTEEYFVTKIASTAVIKKLKYLARKQVKAQTISLWYYILKEEGLLREGASITEFNKLIESLVQGRWNVPKERGVQLAYNRIEVIKDNVTTINKSLALEARTIKSFFSN